MSPNRKHTRFWFGIWMVVLLLLAACVSRADVVEPTQTAPVTLATATATLPPTPTAAVQEPLAPAQLLPHSLAWDPAGRWLAYASADGRVWLRDPTSESVQAIPGITSLEPADLRIAWAPGGRHLLAYGQWGLDDPRQTGLWLVTLTEAGSESAQPIVAPGASRSPVEQNSGAVTSVAWSADGAQFAYAYQAEAWVYDLASGQSRQVTRLADAPLARPGATEPLDGVREVAWAPDGASLALGLSCNCPSPWSGVGLVDAPAGQASASQETRLLVDGGQDVGWSPDGRWITFQNAAGDWTGGSTFDFYGVEPASAEVVNLTRSNPGWDPLRPAEGIYQDAPYQTARLHWGPDGRFLFETLDFLTPGERAPQWGFAVKDGPQGPVDAHLGTLETWYLFPAWLADGRYAYLEANAAASTESAFTVQRAVAGSQATATQPAIVHGAAWAPDGSAVALCVSDSLTSLPTEVTILPLGSK